MATNGEPSLGEVHRGLDSEGNLVYAQTELDDRHETLVRKFQARQEGLRGQIWASVDVVLGALTLPHYLPLAGETIEVLTELLHRAEDRRDYLSGDLWRCGFCGDILKPEMAGEHINRRHKHTDA